MLESQIFSSTQLLKQSMKNVLHSKLSHLLFILLIFLSSTTLVRCDSPSTSSTSSNSSNQLSQSGISNSSNSISAISSISLSSIINAVNGTGNDTSTFVDELSKLETVLFDYVEEVLTQNFFNVISSFTSSMFNTTLDGNDKSASEEEEDDEAADGIALRRSFTERVVKLEKLFAKTRLGAFSSPRAVQTGRLFFFKGLKKLLWPLIFGLQIIKLFLLVLFLPGIIGSVGKILGKGLPSFSGFSQPAEHVEDLDFKDNSYGHGQDAYANDYPVDSETANSFVQHMYETAAAGTTNMLTRYGLTQQKSDLPYSAHVPQMQKTKMNAKKDDFKTFHDIPSSSLMLSTYDPFYSPLLSRLDAVFQQMNLGKDEKCREKLICLMYANPAKYAPYSNLVSAQLSRELNELRKPTSDNPDILRFFKYMRAAKDGQDRVDCGQTYDCVTVTESENPAMLSTFNDINKLVSARKLQ